MSQSSFRMRVHWAAHKGNVGAIKALKRVSGDVAAGISVGGRLCIRRHAKEMRTQLRHREAGGDVAAQDKDGRTGNGLNATSTWMRSGH